MESGKCGGRLLTFGGEAVVCVLPDAHKRGQRDDGRGVARATNRLVVSRGGGGEVAGDCEVFDNSVDCTHQPNMRAESVGPNERGPGRESLRVGDFFSGPRNQQEHDGWFARINRQGLDFGRGGDEAVPNKSIACL